MNRVERFAPLVTGILFALPVLIARFPPMADLPLHEASVGLLRHWGDPRFAPPALYFVNLGHSNQLFSLLALALSFVVPIHLATKIVVALGLVALPLAAARFADHVAAPRWTALLVAPVGLGWMFFWGLIQNILGLAVLVAFLPTIDRFAAKPTARGALSVCGAMVALHFAHQAMQLVACAALVFCCLGVRTTLRLTALRAAPLVFSLAVVYAASKYAWHFAGPVHKDTSPFAYNEVSYKLETIPGVIFGGFEPYVRNLMMVLGVTPVVFAIAERVRRSRRWSGFQEAVHDLRFDLLALMLFAIYLVAPLNIKSTTLVYHRFLPPAWAVLAVSAAAGTRGALRLVPRALCAVLPVASLLIAWPTFVDSHRIYSALDLLMTRMDPGSTVLAVNLGPDPPNRLWNPVVAMGYVVAEHGGRAMYDYSQSPISIVSQRPEKQWGRTVERLAGRMMDVRPAWDLQQFRYLLVSTTDASLGIVLSIALHDDATMVASAGDWYLFESKLPLVAADADEPHLHKPYPPTLASLVSKVSDELEAKAKSPGGCGTSIAPEDLAPRLSP